KPIMTAALGETLIDAKAETVPLSAPPAVVSATASAPEIADTASNTPIAPAPRQTAAARAEPAPVVAQAVNVAEEIQIPTAGTVPATEDVPTPSVPAAAPQEVLPAREPIPPAPVQGAADLAAAET